MTDEDDRELFAVPSSAETSVDVMIEREDEHVTSKKSSSKRLGEVSADVFELKLMELVDRTGSLSNREAARHAARLFSDAAGSSKERKSLALAVLGLTLPRTRDDRSKVLIFNTFLADGHGAELLAAWYMFV